MHNLFPIKNTVTAVPYYYKLTTFTLTYKILSVAVLNQLPSTYILVTIHSIKKLTRIIVILP